MGHYAFFSLFPLLLVLVTILGFVLQGDPSAQKSVENSVLGQFPVIGSQIKLHALSGHVAALVIGIVTSLYGGLGVTNAAQNAFDRVWAVPFKARPNFLSSRLRGLGLLVVLGVLFVISTGVSGLLAGFGGPLLKVGEIVVSFAVNCALYLAAFRFLTAATVKTRCLYVGVIVAALLWTVLQIVGGLYIEHVYKKESGTYSQFALVIALIVWLHLGAQMTLYAAEINTVIARRLWPRSLFGLPASQADKETYTALAKVEERHEIEQVDVHFHR